MRPFRRPKVPESPSSTGDDLTRIDSHRDDYEPSWYVPHDGNNETDRAEQAE